MNKFKKGGGNQLQKYDSKTGEYVEEKIGPENIIMKYLFGLDTGNIDFPSFNKHSKEYAEEFVNYCIENYNPIIKDNKMDYLLQFREENDKSKILVSMGYDVTKAEFLKEEILKNTSFNKKVFSKFENKTYTFLTNTVLLDCVTKKKINFISVWNVNSNKTMHLVTMYKGELL